MAPRQILEETADGLVKSFHGWTLESLLSIRSVWLFSLELDTELLMP
jgi:hypothetical protein